MSPVRAPVRPRVVAPETGDVLPLEDVIDACLNGEERGVVWIVGDPGSGRSTALSHLEAVLSDDESLQFVDDSAKSIQDDPDTINPNCLTFYAGPMPFGAVRPLVELELAPWGRDELMEYLLAAHPEQCGSVLQRLTDSRYLERLHGLPKACRIVLDQMAADTELTSPLDGLRRAVAASLIGQTRIEHVQSLILGQCTARTDLVSRALRDVEMNPALQRLLQLDIVLEVLVSDAVIGSLRLDRRCEVLSHRFEESVLELIADQIDDFLYKRLQKIVNGRNAKVQPMAASILHMTGREWRPAAKRRPNLEGAILRGVQWSGIDLSHASMIEAKLDGSNLGHAKLTHAKVDGASLRGVCLRSAELDYIKATGTNLAYADLIQASLTSARLGRAMMIGADLTGSTLIGSVLNSACLRDARLAHANLEAASLLEAIVDGADFTGADLSAADLNGLDLSNTTLTDAVFGAAHMIACNLEGVQMRDACFRCAALQTALLTGSRLPNADFGDARLDGAGLADIDWPGANLRGASFKAASFHLGSSRSGLVDSFLASEGTRTGFYTDDYHDQSFRDPEEIRKANLCGADLTGADVTGTDWYLVDLRGAVYTADQRRHFEACHAILD